MMEPKLSFTIPSIHDETTLDCRLHYSVCYESASNKYQARGAIIAHPYAPLGGCYDDPVVSQVVAEILKQSYGFVCTFNFR
jgi:alpha/beta superfamily hydrolase